MSNYSFNPVHARAADKPNVFKLAQRMATALVASPKQENGRWVFVIDKPEDQGYLLAKDLLKVALKAADPNLYWGWEVEQGRGKESGKLYVRTPYEGQDVMRPTLPLHEISHHLKRIQDALSIEWVKDDAGNYRHTKVFEKYGTIAMGDGHCIDPSKFRDLLCDILPDASIDDARLFDPRKREGDELPSVNKLPTSGVPGTSGYAIGLCLSEDQVNALAQAVGFRSPVRAK